MIYCDTREKYPLQFDMYNIPYQSKKLDTGDYTFAGYEDVVCIERKRTVCELALNIGSDWKRFSAELERMQYFTHKYILCEFSPADIERYPNCKCVPISKRKFIKIRPQFIQKRIDDIQDQFNIIFFFCQNTVEAEQKVVELYETIYQK